LKKKPITNLYWSPKGNFVVMAGLKGFNGTLEFYNVNELETMATDEHFMATHVTWDPTGRYLATYVSAWEHQVENGYNIWTFQGKLLKHVGKDKFYQFFWRPRPPSLVSAAQEEKLHKELLPTYVKKYQEIDANRRADAARVEDEKRKKLRQDWASYEAQKVREWDESAPKRADILRGKRYGDDIQEHTQLIEEFIETLREYPI